MYVFREYCLLVIMYSVSAQGVVELITDVCYYSYLRSERERESCPLYPYNNSCKIHYYMLSHAEISDVLALLLRLLILPFFLLSCQCSNENAHCYRFVKTKQTQKATTKKKRNESGCFLALKGKGSIFSEFRLSD